LHKRQCGKGATVNKDQSYKIGQSVPMYRNGTLQTGRVITLRYFNGRIWSIKLQFPDLVTKWVSVYNINLITINNDSNSHREPVQAR
ncbi:MAG: hypothetical protein JXR53_06835, partial [Bacteroidales bacterium]|nr:hypothetical protein [Bacteroidales bacterium]